jgi:hypothetical protein
MDIVATTAMTIAGPLVAETVTHGVITALGTGAGETTGVITGGATGTTTGIIIAKAAITHPIGAITTGAGTLGFI